MNAALHKKIRELQRNLSQVTNEKVNALMELAQLKQEYQLLLQKDDQDIKQGKPLSKIGGKKIVQDGEGRFKNLLKKTYLKRWVSDSEGNDAESYLTFEANSIGLLWWSWRSCYLCGGKILKDFPEMSIANETSMGLSGNMLIAEELAYNKELLKMEHETLVTQLTDEQKNVYDFVMNDIDSNEGGLFFVYG
ncbi:PREDICTED: uncharacterized protein LOC109177108 [Ipomoea nil]|uniref:uncharacterized protein LOC109177108 n=1 Tax=Ipomoea nil TaxID=35883 RepID=UPI000900A81C|nr:PREDICTED: uncharacterized protein LOC109177108 [Ipomoea nil]